MPKISSTRKKGSGKHFRGNSIEEGTPPQVIAARQRFAIQWAGNRGQISGRPKKGVLTEAIAKGLEQNVIIDGKVLDVTVAQHIAQQRILEAMQPAVTKDDVALEATKLILDRTEGKPVTSHEVSGPDGGPIEKVEISAVLAKLLS